MALYFFDTRDDETFIEDDVGREFPDLVSVQREASKSLAELAEDVIPGALKRTLKVEVRDVFGPVLMAFLIFEAVILRPVAEA